MNSANGIIFCTALHTAAPQQETLTGTAARSPGTREVPLAASGLEKELRGEKQGSSCCRGQDMGSLWLTLTLPALGPFPVSPLGTSWSLVHPQLHGQDSAQDRGWGQGSARPSSAGSRPGGAAVLPVWWGTGLWRGHRYKGQELTGCQRTPAHPQLWSLQRQ